MSWERYLFQGKDDPQPKKVWAEVNSDGQLVDEDGLVNIKFERAEAAKVYSAGLTNLSPVESETSDQTSNQTVDDSPDLDPASPEVSRDIPPGLAPPDLPGGADVLIYTDGATSSASNSGSGPTGIGVVFWNGSNYKEVSQFIGVTTNQVAELQAIKVALKNLGSTGNSFVLRTDSQYAKKALTEWIHGWRRNGWVNSSGDPVANQGLIKPVAGRLEEFEDFEIEWVEGHSGESLNERADDLAVRAVEKYG